MTELLVSTKKGLFVLEGDARAGFAVKARAFAGEPVEYAIRDSSTGRVLAATTSPFYGPKIFYSEDPAGEWEQAQGIALPEDSGEALVRIWVITAAGGGRLHAGADPGALFESRDGGASWELNRSLWEHRVDEDWQPGGGGLCLHSIAYWPGEPERLAVGVSAAGVWLTEDGGLSWRRGNRGLVPRYLPEETREQLNLPEPDPSGEVALCIHHLERAPNRPDRLFMQFHGGVYRSDDAGSSWTAIGEGLPSDFGFPLAVDPADPDCAYVIPLVADMDRVTPGGRVRVFETRDAGASWIARGDGLPQEHAYLTVLRQAFTTLGDGGGLSLYFGATSGDVFSSPDAGASWSVAATRLPPVFALTAS